MRRRFVALLVVLAAVVGVPAPAGADPAEPTTDRSTVRRIVPSTTGVEARIVGGDSFFELRVDPGVRVIVPGYGGEPYLRFLPDGTVERNLRSPATYLNEDRYAGSEPPDDLDEDDEPEWERVASGGTYAWHDHRIHWMAPDRPPGLEPGDVIQPWEVPMTVDGAEVTVEGVLRWERPVSPLPWAALVIVAAVAAVLAARRRSVLVTSAMALLAAAFAVGVAAAERSSVPSGAQASTFAAAVPVVAVLAASVALAASTRRRRDVVAVASLLSVASTIGWVVLRVDVFFEPVLPTTLDPAVDRAGTALALGVAAGVAVAVTRSGALARPAPVDGDGRDPA
jgi:hypothetical protein